MHAASSQASPGFIDLSAEQSSARFPSASPIALASERLISFWRKLIASNTTLLLILLAVNAWALPYAGLVHDARLYGIQVVNRVEKGSFDGDLYLQYGSQDRYTIFSNIATPLVQILGLRSAFFLIYLVSIVVFLWGTQRLVLSLCEDRTLASLALIFLATTHMTFAGLENFYVNENFVTPRLAANGLTLWCLALMLEQKTWNAIFLMVLAFALHPLMACSGLIVCLAYYVVPRLSKWHVVALVLVVVASGALFLSDSLAGRLLGRMDAEWRDCVQISHPYGFPAEWAAQDWWHIFGAFGIAAAAIAGPLRIAPHGRMIACVAGVGLAGVLINVVACQLFYALPIQGQSYRWLWLLQYLQIPLGLLLVSSWWQQNALATRIAAVVLAAYLGSIAGDRLQFLALLPILAAFGFYLACPPRSTTRLVGFALCVVSIGWLILHESQALRAYWLKVIPWIDVVEYARTAPTVLLGFARWGLAILGILGLACFCKSRRTASYVLATGAVLLQVGYFGAAWAAERNRPAAGVTLVRDYLKEHGNPQNPTIYWPIGWINHLWFDLHVNSYFEPMQLAGSAFSRENAMEGRRRIRLVKRFELERIRQVSEIYSPLQLQQIEADFEAKLTEPAPTWHDVEALCNEKNLDYLLLKQGFTGRYVTTDGVWYLYDCRAIRADRPARSEKTAQAARSILP